MTNSTTRTARQLTRFATGTRVRPADGRWLGGAPIGANTWTTHGVRNGRLCLQGRTSDIVFVALDSDVVFEVVR